MPCCSASACNPRRAAPGKQMPGDTGPVTMTTQLAPHQQRVVDEKRELDDRREKLMAFFSTPIFHGLPESEQIRLERQAVAMRSYSEILGERIAAF